MSQTLHAIPAATVTHTIAVIHGDVTSDIAVLPRPHHRRPHRPDVRNDADVAVFGRRDPRATRSVRHRTQRDGAASPD